MLKIASALFVVLATIPSLCEAGVRRSVVRFYSQPEVVSTTVVTEQVIQPVVVRTVRPLFVRAPRTVSRQVTITR